MLCFIIIIIINPLTARVVGAPQIILRPVFSIFPVLHCPLGLGELQACPFPVVVFPPFPLSALSSSSFHCALQDGFGQTWWTGDMTIPLQFAFLYDGQEVFVWSDCLLDLGTDDLVGKHGLCMRCVVSCGSTSFPRLVFFFWALLWGSKIHKHTGRWVWQGSTSVVSWNWKNNTHVIPNWFQPCQCCCCLCYPGEYLRLWTLISYNWSRILKLVTISSFCPSFRQKLEIDR